MIGGTATLQRAACIQRALTALFFFQERLRANDIELARWAWHGATHPRAFVVPAGHFFGLPPYWPCTLWGPIGLGGRTPYSGSPVPGSVALIGALTFVICA